MGAAAPICLDLPTHEAASHSLADGLGYEANTEFTVVDTAERLAEFR